MQIRTLLICFVHLLMVACSAAPAYKSTLIRTEGGIPHIIASDFASLGYGTGYASAQDNLCLIAKHVLELDGRLSAHFGPQNGNLESDFFYQFMNDLERLSAPADPEFEALFRGYAAGYNRYLRDTGIDALPDPTCRDALWVRQISASDIRKIHLNPFFLSAFRQMIVDANPPAAVESAAENRLSDLSQLNSALALLSDKGSNGVAIGKEGVAEGRALLFANPHLDQRAEQRFYPMHQIMPGTLNLLGATQIYRASVGIGTNGSIAWTNTVSPAQRFSFYQLQLVPDEPTSYLIDGKPMAMVAHPVSVPVLQDDGGIAHQSHTFYTTHNGFLVGGFPWNSRVAYALRLAEEANRGINGGTSAAYQAQTVEELKAIHDQYQFMTVNLVAADAGGQVLYGDLGPMPNLSDAQLQECRVASGRALDGSRSECEWKIEAGSAAEGQLPARYRPSLIRNDYVLNSNDSYWLSNSKAPFQKLPEILGTHRTERTLRTRSALSLVDAQLESGSAFTLDSLIQLLMNNQNMAGRLIRDDLVRLCTKYPELRLDGETVSLTEACSVLSRWDLSGNLESRGAHVFREFMIAANELSGPSKWQRVYPAALTPRVPFDATQAVATPSGLNVESAGIALQALARAVKKLRASGIALDARLGDIQGEIYHGEFVGLTGGIEQEGVFNKMAYVFTGDGYRRLNGASASWLMGISLGPEGPVVKGVLAYPVSSNPLAPEGASMPKRFAATEFLELPFLEQDVREAAISQIELVEGSDSCKSGAFKTFSSLAFSSESECKRFFQNEASNRLTDFVETATDPGAT